MSGTWEHHHTWRRFVPCARAGCGYQAEALYRLGDHHAARICTKCGSVTKDPIPTYEELHATADGWVHPVDWPGERAHVRRVHVWLNDDGVCTPFWLGAQRMDPDELLPEHRRDHHLSTMRSWLADRIQAAGASGDPVVFKRPESLLVAEILRQEGPRVPRERIEEAVLLAAGCAWSEACRMVDEGKDPRMVELPDVLDRITAAVKQRSWAGTMRRVADWSAEHIRPSGDTPAPEGQQDPAGEGDSAP